MIRILRRKSGLCQVLEAGIEVLSRPFKFETRYEICEANVKHFLMKLGRRADIARYEYKSGHKTEWPNIVLNLKKFHYIIRFGSACMGCFEPCFNEILLDSMASNIRDFIQHMNLKGLAGDRIYARGRRYFLEHRVKLENITPKRVTARVVGTRVYHTEFFLKNGIGHFSCTCPYGFFCKHLVALALKINEINELQELHKAPSKTPQRAQVRRLSDWENYLQTITPPQDTTPARWAAIFNLSIRPYQWVLEIEKAYIRKDGSLGRRSYLTLESLDNPDVKLSEKEKMVLSYCLASDEFLRFDFAANAYLDVPQSRLLAKNQGAACGEIFSLLRDSKIFLKKEDFSYTPLRFSPEKGRIRFKASRQNQDIICHPVLIWSQSEEPLGPQFVILTSDPVWILKDDLLIEIEGL
ncbi:MAG: hypothetical protein D6814_10325, partial [Calditrichaeota bacterium]